MDKNIFRTYDIRGIAISDNKNEIQISNNDAYLIGKAIATHLIQTRNSKTIVVGADCRITSPEIKEFFTKGLLETGLDVTDIGLSPTPMMYWVVTNLKFDAGVNITASHNPKNDNGFKIVSKNAESVFGDELTRLYEIIEKNEFLKQEKIGKLNHIKPWPQYLEDLKSKVKINKKLKVVIDAGNGATGPYIKDLFEGVGCETITLFEKADGTFPNHEANPEKEKNMMDLIKKVKETNADLGIGFDGDGDRLGLIDENGKMYSAEYILLLFTTDLIKRIPNPTILFDTKFSQAIINELEKLGANAVMYKTGHSLIKKKMKELKANLAGEVSGHIFITENYYGFDDAFLAAIKSIEIIANSNKKLSEHFNKVEKTITTEEIKASCPDGKKAELVKKIVQNFTKKYDCITIDGVRIKLNKISWALIRASNTSPYLTLRFEAKTKEEIKEMQKIVFEELNKYPEINNDWYRN